MKVTSRTLFLLLALCALAAGCAGTSAPPFAGPSIAPASVACAPPAAPGRPPAPAAEQTVARVLVSADPETATSLVNRGWDKSRDGERDAAVALYELALKRPDSNMPAERIQWSYGWAMFNLQDHTCALAHFDAARQAAPEQARWVPQTFAVTYWQMGERDVALRWYDEAAKNEPGCWIDAKAAARCTRHWQRQERRALGELLTAWKRQRLEQAGQGAE